MTLNVLERTLILNYFARSIKWRIKNGMKKGMKLQLDNLIFIFESYSYRFYRLIFHQKSQKSRKEKTYFWSKMQNYRHKFSKFSNNCEFRDFFVIFDAHYVLISREKFCEILKKCEFLQKSEFRNKISYFIGTDRPGNERKV